MTPLDVTMTATLRHEVLEETLASFRMNLFKNHPIRLIINIDPVGDSTVDDVLKVCEKYIDFRTEWNAPDTPSFPKAFRWVWSKVSSPVVFHLEEDWALLREVDLDVRLLFTMAVIQDLAILRLPFFKSGIDSMKNWNLFFPYNGLYYECPQELKKRVGFCGHPSLIRKDWIVSVRDHLTDDFNPEKALQFSDKRGDPELQAKIEAWNYAVIGKPGDDKYIDDLGRPWMARHPEWRKKGNKSFFTEWTKVDINE